MRLNVKGSILLYVMVYGSLAFSFIVIGLAGYAVSENRASMTKNNSEQAFQIAESGIAYYRWHLAHNKNDFWDGQGASSTGPYEHFYLDKSGVNIGTFSLQIVPPPITSTIVTIVSTGWAKNQPNTKRTVRVKLGFPSLTDFSFLTNSTVWIGDTEQTHGKFHSNSGVRFDGTGDAQISSAVATYKCPSGQGCNGNPTKNGVWGTGGPQNFWMFPMPAEDFTAITADLAQIKSDAEDNGIYLSSSGAQGWHLTFTSSSNIMISKVTRVNCYLGADIGEGTLTNKCFDAGTFSASSSYPAPANGRIFVEDNVWVDGVVNGHIVVGTAAGKNIIIHNNLKYRQKNGNDALGLIAERNILVPLVSPNNLEINAALLAQNGAVKRLQYRSTYATNLRNSIVVYGSIITNTTWTWSYAHQSNGNWITDSGYVNTNSTYDANLTYSPPPGFPIGSEYNLISWELLK